MRTPDLRKNKGLRAELRLKWNNGKQVSENHGVLRGFFYLRINFLDKLMTIRLN